MRISLVFRHQNVDLLSGQFRSLVPEQFFRGCINELDRPLVIYQHHAVLCALKQKPNVSLLKY